MFERFTDKARTVVILARTKATERGDQIRPVYMLHALTSADGVAARALAELGVDTALDRALAWTAPRRCSRPARGRVAQRGRRGAGRDRHRPGRDQAQGRGELRPGRAASGSPAAPKGRRAGPGGCTLTRESKQSLGLAVKEARALRHDYIGTEHLLLGLLGAAERNPRGDFTPATLRDLGIDPARARQQVLDELRHGPRRNRRAARASRILTRR